MLKKKCFLTLAVSIRMFLLLRCCVILDIIEMQLIDSHVFVISEKLFASQETLKTPAMRIVRRKSQTKTPEK